MRKRHNYPLHLMARGKPWRSRSQRSRAAGERDRWTAGQQWPHDQAVVLRYDPITGDQCELKVSNHGTQSNVLPQDWRKG